MSKFLKFLIYMAFALTFLPIISPISVSAQDDEPLLLLRENLGNGNWKLVWSPDSTMVVAYDYFDTSLTIFDIQEGRSIYEFPDEAIIQDVAWVPESTLLLIGTNAGVVEVVDFLTGSTQYQLDHPDAVYHIRVSEDGEYALISGGFDTARMWNIDSGEIQFELAPDESIIQAEWDENLGRITTFSNDGFMSIWDSATGDHLLTIQHDDWIYGSTWNADGSQIITYGQDHTARLTDFATGEILLDLAHDNVVYDAMWLADEMQLMTYSGDGFVHIWSLDGTEIRTLSYRGFSLQDDGITILSRNREVMQTWYAESGEEIRAFLHESLIITDEVSPNQTRLLTWTQDDIGRIWDLSTGEIIWQTESELREVAWSPNSNMIAIVADDVLDVWGMPH